MNNDVRKITDGAMMAAIMGLVMFLNRQTAGALETSFIFLLPLPMVFYGAKYGWRDSWMVFSCIVILAFILSTPASMVLMTAESLIGMIYGCGVHNGVDSNRLLLRTVIGAVTVDFVTMVLLASFFGYDLNADVEMLKGLVDQLGKVSETDPVALLAIKNYLKTMLLCSVVLIGVIEGFATHAVSRLMLHYLRINVQRHRATGVPIPPKWTGYLALLSYVSLFYVIKNPFQAELLNSVIVVVGMCFTFFLMFYGMIAVSMITRSYLPNSKFLRALILLVILFTVSFILILFGYLFITTSMRERFTIKG